MKIGSLAYVRGSNSKLTVIDRDVSGTTVSQHNDTGHDAWAEVYGYGGFVNLKISNPDNVPHGPASPNFAGAEPYGPIGAGAAIVTQAYTVQMFRGDQIDDGRLAFQGVRAVDPTTATWMTPDASGGDTRNPLTQKAYTWLANNPVSKSDPTGFAANDGYIVGHVCVAMTGLPCGAAKAPAADGQPGSVIADPPSTSDVFNVLGSIPIPDWAISAQPLLAGSAVAAQHPREAAEVGGLILGAAIPGPDVIEAAGAIGAAADAAGAGAASIEAGAATSEAAGATAEASGATPFAMGLGPDLEAFASARGATTWKDLPDPVNWKSGVLDKLNDASTVVHFNLDGVDVFGGLSRAAAGRGGATDWELLQIWQNPQFWESLQFWKNGFPAANPFAD